MGLFMSVQRRHVARFALMGVVAISSLAIASASSATKAPKKTYLAPSSTGVVKVATVSGLGQVLTTSTGMALYTYGPDTKNHSACTGACATAWPPLTVGAKVHPKGITGLGTFRRSSTLFQVTYRGRPLYTYVGDTTVGSVTGNGVGNFKAVFVKASKGHSPTTTTTGASGGY